VHSERYSAWREAPHRQGDARQVLGYGQRRPVPRHHRRHRATAYTPEEPRVSRLQLDMGVRLPVLADWPAGQPVNGQQAHLVGGAVAGARGRWSLKLAPALLPRSQDTAADYLPLTPRLLLRQAFKFLGERYGWGHDYDTRDCSGFVSEIYRSFGVLLPRNTSAQAVSPALDPPAVHRHGRPARRAVTAAGRRPGLHPRPRDDGHRPRRRPHLGDPRYGGRQLVRCRRQARAPISMVFRSRRWSR
jgi:hypothetical protein